MEIKCAPTYANIFMAEFNEKRIYTFVKQISMIYLIFINEIFMMWTRSENELENFMKYLNTKQPSIKINFKYSKEKIEFLDILVYVDKNPKLKTNLYQKPTDSQNYLHANSKHIPLFKKAFLVSTHSE